MYDVITAGSATVDAFAQTGDKLFRGTTGFVRVPFGSKILIEDITFDVGGGGTNTAVSFSRLGLRVAFLGKIGSGTNSQRVLQLLKREKVDTSLIPKCRGRTGFSIILDAYKRDRTVLTFKGSNDLLRYKELPLRRMRTQWFYFSSMMNESFKTLERLAVWAHKRKIHIMFNPSSYLTEKGMSYLKKLLSYTQILVLNKEEACMLAKKNSIRNVLVSLHRRGPRVVIVTDGKKGVHMYDNKLYYRAKPRVVKVVETTGAGDAFGAGFLAGYIRTHDPEFALRLGLLNSASVVQHLGAKNNLLRWNEAVSLMKRQMPRVVRKHL